MTQPTSVVVQQRNAEMTSLASSDLLSVNDKNAAIQVYDASGLGSFTLGVTLQVALDTLSFSNHFPEVFSFESNVITVLEHGLYHFYGSSTATQAGGSSAAGLNVWIDEDPATGVWALLPVSSSYYTVPAISAARASGSFSFTKHVAPGYRYRMRTTQHSGSGPFTTVAGMSLLGIIRLFKTG